MSEEAARALYLAMVDAHGASPQDDFEELAESLRARLKALSAVLYPAYLAARRQGDRTEANALNNILSRIELLWISLNQELIAHIDTSSEVATASERIGAINKKLVTETDHAARAAADLAQIGNILTQVSTLIGWIKDA